MRKVICPSCNETIEIDDTQTIFVCEHCQTQIETIRALKTTELYLNRILKAANQYVENAYSYSEAYKYFKEFLVFVPNNLDAIIGMLYSLLKTSSLKNNVFEKFINEFNANDIVLESTTYIRLGHFFEQSLKALFTYQNNIIKYHVSANEKEKEIVYYNLIGLLKTYDFLNENILLFTDQEYIDSIFISKDEINANKDRLLTFMKSLNVYQTDYRNFDDAIILFNNRRILYSAFDINNYDDVNDFAIFKVVNNAQSMYKYIFFALISLFALSIVGLILVFAIPTNTIIGYSILGVALGLFFVVYGAHYFLRKKMLKELDN